MVSEIKRITKNYFHLRNVIIFIPNNHSLTLSAFWITRPLFLARSSKAKCFSLDKLFSLILLESLKDVNAQSLNLHV